MADTTPTRPRRRGRAIGTTAVLAALLLLVAASCGSDEDGSSSDGGSDGTSVDTESVLGEPNPASGEPVTVGFVYDGRTPSIDNTMHLPAAEATVEYINEYQNGIAGRPVGLVSCASEGDPGKATECGNEMVQEGVVMTIMPENQQPTAVHTVMAANDIPLFVYGVTDPAITEDAESSFMIASLTAGLSALPIDVAEEEGIDKVTVMVVDVPAATDFYDDGAFGAQQFADADIELETIRVPLGTVPDNQINEVVTGDETVLHIVGDPGLCIAAINGLKTNGFDGPITVLNGCSSEDINAAVGENMDGVIMASPTPLGDESNSGIQLFQAILAEYDPGFGDYTEGLTTFMTVYSAWQSLDGIGEEITSDTIRTTVHGMEQEDLVTGAGLGFRCNGKAAPQTPAVCTRGALRVTLDGEGKPILPYEPFGTSPIPD